LNFKKNKKGKIVFDFFGFYGRFLSTKIVTAKPIAMTTMMPTTAGIKYMSTTDCGAAGGGVAVAAGSAAWKAVDADDG
jgi:hypothetical protein